MFGEFGPKLKGGWNAFIAVFTSSGVSLKTQPKTALTIQPGDQDGPAGVGTSLIANGGVGSGTGAGGAATLNGGAGVGSGAVGGTATVKGGSSAVAAGGQVVVSGGDAASSAAGGAVTIQGGAGNSAAGGAVIVRGGTGSGSGASVTITTANAGTVAPVNINSGAGTSFAAGGTINIVPGVSSDAAGAPVNVTGGAANGSNTGGKIALTGGAAGGSNSNGGPVSLKGGAATGTGAAGNIVLNDTGSALATTATGGFTCLPSCAGLPTGVPAVIPTGTVPSVYDTTNARLMVYTGGAWKASFNAATQAQQETATSLVDAVTPGSQKFHPSAVKAWAKADTAGNVTVAYNVASVTDTAVGRISFNLTTAFSSADYAATASAMQDTSLTAATSLWAVVRVNPSTASIIAVDCIGPDTAAPAFHDPSYFLMMASGDQ